MADLSRLIPSLVLAVAVVPRAGAAPSPLVRCLDPATDEPPAACVRSQLGDRPPTEADLRALDPLLDSDPERALAALEALTPPASDALRAALLDREAAALAALGRTEQAADRQLRAFELEPGTEWVRHSPTRAASGDAIEIEVGPRLGLTAQRLRAAGRSEQALGLSARAKGIEAGSAVAQTASGKPAEPTASRELVAGPWHQPLPDVEIAMFAGDAFFTADARGRVLVLDFWASWCEPCLRELPSLQALYESERARGLEVVLVNVGESADTVARFAAAHGLTMPHGFYDEGLEELTTGRRLPTVILADRSGRIRARFDGYVEGLEKTIASRVRALLDGVQERSTRLADVDLGAGSFEVDWMRTLDGTIEGLRVARVEPGAPSIVAAAAREIATLDSRGAVLSSWPAPEGGGSLRTADLDGDGHAEIMAFRRGGGRIAVTTLDQDPIVFDAPEPVFDLVAFETPALDESEAAAASATLWLATLGGLHRTDSEGLVAGSITTIGTTLELAAVENGQLAALGSGGLCWFRPGDEANLTCGPARGAMGLLGAGEQGLVELSAGVISATRGSFTREGAFEIAAATRSGTLVVLDPASRSVSWRARWPGVALLSSGDLDGDGLDELVVAHGKHLTVLHRVDPAVRESIAERP